MTEAIIDILIASSPIVLASFGALTSEYCGVMAVFTEGLINLGAFLCFAFTVFTDNLLLGIVGAVVACGVFIGLIAVFIEKTRANAFLAGAALNLFSSGIVSLLSTAWFDTNGVIAHPIISPTAWFVRGGTTVFAWLLVMIFSFIVRQSVWGLRLRTCGTNARALELNGVHTTGIRVSSWIVAGALSALAGCILTVRLQSYVPNISAGRGWIALATVFLGRKKILGVIASAVIFAVAEYGANRLQGLYGIPPSLLLSAPYIVALLCFLLLPKQKESL